MKLSYSSGSVRAVRSDALIYLVSQIPESLQRDIRTLRSLFGTRLDHAIRLEHFSGKEGEVLSLYTDRKLAAPRLYLSGIGKQSDAEHVRRAAAAAVKQATSAKLTNIAFVVPSGGKGEETASTIKAVLEGAILSTYKYDKYFTSKDERQPKINTITLVGDAKNAKVAKAAVREAKILCEAVFLARDLENAPGNEIYPETLAQCARDSGDRHGFRVVVWDLKRIEQSGFGGLMAVNSGSRRPARFIILEYNSGRQDLETIVLVGKGVTFDSGGISIKPAQGMAEMKMDMSGAAAVIGTFEAAARLSLPVHLVGLIPATENMPGGSSMRPGDIIIHYGGKTSEVDNTDAEGRLILADALAYAAQYDPDAVIDLATLTGACVVALGHHATGMMGNDDALMAELSAAGNRTFERVWQLPLFEEYEKQIKSDVADVKNVGGRWGGAITAALFLKRFIADYKWVHLDIAGTAILEESLPYAPKGGSGVGVRLLIDFLQNRQQP